MPPATRHQTYDFALARLLSVAQLGLELLPSGPAPDTPPPVLVFDVSNPGGTASLAVVWVQWGTGVYQFNQGIVGRTPASVGYRIPLRYTATVKVDQARVILVAVQDVGGVWWDGTTGAKVAVGDARSWIERQVESRRLRPALRSCSEC